MRPGSTERWDSMSYSAILLDLYGTLVDIHTEERDPALWATMADWYTRHGAPWTAAALQDAYFATVSGLEGNAPQLRQDAHEAHPEIRIEDVFRALFAQKGQTADAALVRDTGLLFRRASTEYIRLYDGAVSFLQNLREVGEQVILLSNAQNLFTMEELRNLAITDCFDDIYLSSDWGFKKPDPRFYRVPLEQHHLHPEHTVMIGNDGVCDIEGARTVGMHTVYLKTNLSPREPLPQADLCVDGPDFSAILAYLRQNADPAHI